MRSRADINQVAVTNRYFTSTRPNQSPDQPPRKRTEPQEHGVSKPNAYGLPHTEAKQPPPIALSEAQMCALLLKNSLLPHHLGQPLTRQKRR